MRALAQLVLAAALVTSACEGRPGEHAVDRDLLSHLPKHEEQRRALCARGREDAVTAAFCTDAPPAVSSLADVQRLLGVSFDAEVPPAFSFVGHSSALPSRSVSAINPGSVIVSLPIDPRPLNGNPGPRRSDGNIVSLAFARGDQVVEFAVTPPGGEATFYLLRYEQPCNDGANEEDCSFAELFSDETEAGWLRWSLYDDDDLSDSVLDCLHCHQPDGPTGERIYRMQELENPWTHWMAPFTLSGRVLLDDMRNAHGTAHSIAGIPGNLAARSDPVAVEDLVRFAGSVQPNEFPSPQIEREVQQSNPAQPANNTTPGVSASWQLVYDASVRGEAIPPPYHDVKVTDPVKLADVTRALTAFREGSRATMPDLRDVFHDDALAGMSHRPKPGLDGRAILVHACAQCHNSRLDQSLGRARFDAIDLESMSVEARELAIQRMSLEPEDRFRMPPRLFRDLSQAEIEAATEALR